LPAGIKIALKLGSLALTVVVLCLKSINAQSVDPLPLEIHRPPVSMLFSVSAQRLSGRLEEVQNGLILAALKTRIEVYQAEGRKPCCNKPNLVGSQVTTANGDFRF
jgi:hypothetical protein